MNVDHQVLKKWNELFEKYELDSVPKSSWKDLCLIEMRKYRPIHGYQDENQRLSNPEGKF